MFPIVKKLCSYIFSFSVSLSFFLLTLFFFLFISLYFFISLSLFSPSFSLSQFIFLFLPFFLCLFYLSLFHLLLPCLVFFRPRSLSLTHSFSLSLYLILSYSIKQGRKRLLDTTIRMIERKEREKER